MKSKNLTPTDILRELREVLIEAPPESLDECAKENGASVTSWSQISQKAATSALARLQKEQEAQTRGIHKGLTSFLVLLRRRDGLDQEELSEKADVDIEEIRKIESDSTYEPTPRTIYHLERVFSLPNGVLAKLTGTVRTSSPQFEERALQFAANAKSMGKLSRDEMKLLSEFVRFLTEKA